jgi:hypothetical protein
MCPFLFFCSRLCLYLHRAGPRYCCHLLCLVLITVVIAVIVVLFLFLSFVIFLRPYLYAFALSLVSPLSGALTVSDPLIWLKHGKTRCSVIWVWLF